MDDRPESAEQVRQRERLSARLRENLKRRKAQLRGRRNAAALDPARPSHDSAGIDKDKRED